MSPKKHAPPTPPLWKGTEDWTWQKLVVRALETLEGRAPLHAIYGLLETHPRTIGRAHWQAKVRQELQRASAIFTRVDNGTWCFAEKLTEKENKQFNALRLKRYPRETTPKG